MLTAIELFSLHCGVQPPNHSSKGEGYSTISYFKLGFEYVEPMWELIETVAETIDDNGKVVYYISNTQGRGNLLLVSSGNIRNMWIKESCQRRNDGCLRENVRDLDEQKPAGA